MLTIECDHETKILTVTYPGGEIVKMTARSVTITRPIDTDTFEPGSDVTITINGRIAE